jgi:hypothetical protein
MIYLVWLEYTRFAKEITLAAIFGSSIDKSPEGLREHLSRRLAGEPGQREIAFETLHDAMIRLELAHEPADL